MQRKCCLLLVDCLPGCVFVARRCAKHSKGALACQRRYVSNTKGKMCQSVIVVSYYMSPSHHVIICHNCMQRWQTSTMLLAAVFSDALRTVRCLDLPRIWLLSPTNLAFGFGHSDHKMIATNNKRTINHL